MVHSLEGLHWFFPKITTAYWCCCCCVILLYFIIIFLRCVVFIIVWNTHTFKPTFTWQNIHRDILMGDLGHTQTHTQFNCFSFSFLSFYQFLLLFFANICKFPNKQYSIHQYHGNYLNRIESQTIQYHDFQNIFISILHFKAFFLFISFSISFPEKKKDFSLYFPLLVLHFCYTESFEQSEF